ncbi:TPA: 3-methyl-2-oxobutanoate hydroxymethyltransferase [Candidatus Peregrinibacteria bacterium]|nr:3-methyl-2-oxobutanoate hydroxymethyltransferase [Candidatus Peregrinibacteria bacterium]HIQ57332.1 3-methyl-2-oxobutanoate hydroxymethyltransferase [Candidatus Gracilibacteria bacterium]
MKKVWITAYDVSSATVSIESGVDGILVGDSLGMTVYGFDSTREVTVEIMCRHFEAVYKIYKKNNSDIQLVLDFPFGTTDNILIAVETAEKFKNIGANCFKLEGGKEIISIILELISRGFEIVGHLGLRPQTSELQLHARTEAEQNELLETIKIFDDIGVKNIVLECVPADFAQRAQKIFSGDIIGIGAGRNVNAQILVFDDVIGKTHSDFQPKFLRRFGNIFEHSVNAVKNYKSAVLADNEESFPRDTESY